MWVEVQSKNYPWISSVTLWIIVYAKDYGFFLRVKQPVLRVPANLKKEIVEISKSNSQGMEPKLWYSENKRHPLGQFRFWSKKTPTDKNSKFNQAIRMNLQLTIYAMSFTPETFPQTSRIVVAAIKAFNHFIFTVFNAIIA